jgi:demethoxyubiquinone hydroxylase (CLK1/Coq7/Cat5 family)
MSSRQGWDDRDPSQEEPVEHTSYEHDYEAFYASGGRYGGAWPLGERVLQPADREEKAMKDYNQDQIDQLNSFLRGELSAVETYRLAVRAMSSFTGEAQLVECMRSHEERVRLLREQIQRLGGVPSKTSGAWGTFAALIEDGAAALGQKAALAALEEGEDHGLKDYRTDLPKLAPDVRTFVERSVLPAQIETHRTLSTLKHQIAQRA